MEKIFPSKIKANEEIRVIAPVRSIKILSEDCINIANDRIKNLGYKLSFGQHIMEIDEFDSNSVKSRVEDIHLAFKDKDVKAILTVIGGYNSNQLLRYIDWDLIRKNPKIFCGYSDVTALNNAIFSKTGLVTYSGPHYSSFGQELYFDYTLDYFKKCLTETQDIDIKPSNHWSDDHWYKDQKNRNLYDNQGWLIINEGEAKGTILGANLCTFNLLQGTEYFPNIKDSILFIEDDEESKPHDFDRDLQSLIHQPDFSYVRGIVIGRFQIASGISNDKLFKIIKAKPELNGVPVIANVDFGHTDPKITFPIGGEVTMKSSKSISQIVITNH